MVPASAPAAPRNTSAQAVVDWSSEAERVIVGRAGINPGDAAILMGIVHAAIYDAVVAIEGGAWPYAITPTVPRRASAEVAAAAAAHGVLVGLLPAQQSTLDADYAAYLSRWPDGPAKAGGVAVGNEVASGILALRADDHSNDVVPYVQAPPGPGVFEPTAPFPPFGTNLPYVRPLVLPRADFFRPPGPPALSSEEYAQDLNEVKARGGATSPRTPRRLRRFASGPITPSRCGTGRFSAWSTITIWTWSRRPACWRWPMCPVPTP